MDTNGTNSNTRRHLWLDARTYKQLYPSTPSDAVHGTCGCACQPSARSASAPPSRVLAVEISAEKHAAALICISWQCPDRPHAISTASAHRHSRWMDRTVFDRLPVVTALPDVNAALGGAGGQGEASFAAINTSVSLWRGDAPMGRIAVASRRIRAGECVVRATVFALAVHDRVAKTHCHWCFTRLVQRAFSCGACDYARYCSHQCLQYDAPLHDPQCEVLATLAQRRPASALPQAVNDGDDDSLRLALAIMVMEQFLQTTAPLQGLHQPTGRDGTSSSSTSSSSCATRAALLQTTIATSRDSILRNVPPSHVLRTLQRVECNAHALSVNGTTVVALGMVPEAAMTLNHACVPSVVGSFDPKTRILRFHALHDLAPGDEISSSYLSDLTLSRTRRHKLLQHAFAFTCHCWRCEAEKPLTKEQQSLQEKQSLNALAGLVRARQRNQWHDVARLAEVLLQGWRQHGLPDVHPVPQMLHQHLALAHEKLGDQTLAQQATYRVRDIQRVCGFLEPLPMHART